LVRPKVLALSFRITVVLLKDAHKYHLAYNSLYMCNYVFLLFIFLFILCAHVYENNKKHFSKWSQNVLYLKTPNKFILNTSQIWFIDEDTNHLIIYVQDSHWVIVAQVTRLRSFVVSRESARAISFFFVTLFHAPIFRNLTQRSMACCHTFLLSKSHLRTFNVSVTQRDG